jgi:hypothetical protein
MNGNYPAEARSCQREDRGGARREDAPLLPDDGLSRVQIAQSTIRPALFRFRLH